jgi:hypothetical protein
MMRQPLIELFGSTESAKGRPIKGLTKRVGTKQMARSFARAAPETPTDPYLLLLLADQEMVDGREEQARYLIEAAYEFFDRKARVNVRTLHLVR